MIQSIILGTYTRKKSEGIYMIQLDTEKHQLDHLTHIVNEGNPTYLDITDNGTIYSVCKDGNLGGISAYEKHADGTYSLLNKSTQEGAPPCYVAIDAERHLVFGANYHEGIVTSYIIQPDGSVQLADSVQHTGNGPHDNQNGPHAHFADLTPDKRLVVCDLGNDTVVTYDVADNGILSAVATFDAKPGTGPRHLVFHPQLPIAYLFGELSSEVIVLLYDETSGTFTTKETKSTLPDNYNGFNGGAAIRLSRDGKFLYVSNRGHNSIATFSVSDDGTIELLQFISVEGDFPRDFDLSPDNQFIVVANQNSDNLTLFSRDINTGLLSLEQKDIFAPEVVCVKFK